MVLDREAGDAVVGIGNDFTAHRIDAHLQPVRGGFVTEALADLALGIGMQRQGQAERRAADCRVWSSGVAPMPPKLKTMSPVAKLSFRVWMSRGGSSPT